ncbi:hypothetical protein FH972_023771 [Carpinus fangiana]|uniref:Fucose-specific lectin n=1 Tax=Carpinus fangiana TaxID=176857 RepID=A0A5N6KWE2_9ROSI|nr:hypothetical protein FH972_023771 [Carpinus fangiana]
MASVAVIPSPLGKRSVMLWTADGKSKQLAMEQRSLDNSNYTAYVDRGAAVGAVRATTGLASVIHDHAVTVYGITDYVKNGKSGSTISTLSPIYNPVDPDNARADPGPSYNAVAAAGGSSDYDYIYFLKDPTGLSQQPLIVEYTFNLANPGTRYVYSDFTADPSSALAACLDPYTGNRMVLFQNYQKPFIYFGWSDTQSKQYIVGSNNALKATPLAATLLAYPDKTIEIYMYYVDNNYSLSRASYSGKGSQGQWGKVEPVPGVNSIDAAAGLGVISDTSQGVNHVFYKSSQNSNKDGYIDFQDPFKQALVPSAEGITTEATEVIEAIEAIEAS